MKAGNVARCSIESFAVERPMPLTLALSHPMGEGTNTIARLHECARLQKTRCEFSLSHRMGEGRGEGERLISPNRFQKCSRLSPLPRIDGRSRSTISAGP